MQRSGAVAELVERGPRAGKIGSLVPSRVKPMDWLAQWKDNITEWDIRSWCWQPGLPVGQHYKVTMILHCHKSVPVLMTLDVARM